MARLGRAQPNRPIVVRAHLVDEPDVRGAKPVISTRTDRKFFRTKPVILAQNPQSVAVVVQGAPKSLVVSQPNKRHGKINRVTVTKGQPEVTPVDIRPQTLVVTPGRRGRTIGSTVIIRTAAEGAPIPPSPGPDPDFCVYPPFTDWGAGQLFTDWVASAPVIDWLAGIVEEC